MLTSEYAVYMDTQQAVNLELLRRFREAGVEFALASCASTANSRPLRSRGAGGRETVRLFVAARDAGVRLRQCSPSGLALPTALGEGGLDLEFDPCEVEARCAVGVAVVLV